MKILNLTKNTVIATRVQKADTILSRMTGLLTRRAIAEDEALIITRCKSIHMFFMKFAIDVIFVDRKNTIAGIVEDIKPFALSPTFYKSNYAIEGPAGMIKRSRCAVGDLVQIID